MINHLFEKKSSLYSKSLKEEALIFVRDWIKLLLALNNWNVDWGCSSESSVEVGHALLHTLSPWSLQPSPEWLSAAGTPGTWETMPPPLQPHWAPEWPHVWKPHLGGGGNKRPEQIKLLALRHTWLYPYCTWILWHLKPHQDPRH